MKLKAWKVDFSDDQSDYSLQLLIIDDFFEAIFHLEVGDSLNTMVADVFPRWKPRCALRSLHMVIEIS